MKSKYNKSADSLSNLSISIDYGHTASATRKNTETKFLRITDIQDSFVNWENVPFCECSERERKRYELADGDIVFARTGATTGKSYLINNCPPKSVFASYLIRVRPNERINPKYLFQYFQTSDYWKQISSRSTGTAQAGVNASKLASLQIPLPPLPEQKRIAEVLDKADALREKRRLALQKLDALLQSVFLEMFGDPVKNPKGWKETTISEICFVKGGKRLPKGEDYSPTPTDFRYIRVTDIKNGKIAEKKLHYLYPETQSKISRYIVNEGDVVISIAGSIGLIAPVPKTLDGVNLTENAAKLCPRKSNDYNSTFLSNILKSDYPQQQIGQHTGQVTIGKLALFRIEKIKIPLPPIELQNKFEAFVKKFEAYKDRLEKSLKMSENLFQSLQQRAFKGELFNDEFPPLEPQKENVWQQTSLF